MADIPLKEGPQVGQEIKITPENAAQITAFYAVQIYKRLGYLIKLLEQKANG